MLSYCVQRRCCQKNVIYKPALAFRHFFYFWGIWGPRFQNWDLRIRPLGGNFTENLIFMSKIFNSSAQRSKKTGKLMSDLSYIYIYMYIYILLFFGGGSAERLAQRINSWAEPAKAPTRALKAGAAHGLQSWHGSCGCEAAGKHSSLATRRLPFCGGPYTLKI